MIFQGNVKDDLRIEILGTELDLFDPNDTLGKYTRLFNQKIQSVYGQYGPDQEVIDPENMISWKIWYRIERG